MFGDTLTPVGLGSGSCSDSSDASSATWLPTGQLARVHEVELMSPI